MNKYMDLALKEAYKASKNDEIPIGAVIVNNDKVVSKAHNNRQKHYSVIGHAEINAILKAERKLKDWRLDNCDMYVTLEPCDMCSMIIKESRIKNVYYLLSQNKKSNYKQLKYDQIKLNQYKKMIQNFFENMR